MVEQSFANRTSHRILWVVVLLCLGLVIFLLFRPSAIEQPTLNPSQLSLRQHNDQVQYRLSDGDWQTIATVSALTGKDGKDGVNGQDGEDGTNGQSGKDGRDGVDGTNGVDGADGQDGANGIDGTNGANGTDGREIELQKDLYFIQWRYVGEPGWRNLIAYSELKGDKGDKGDQGLIGPQGPSLWGGISGSLSDQTDLQSALNSKVGLTGN